MKCIPYLIAILICLAIFIIIYLSSLIFKHRHWIKEQWKKYKARKFLICVFLPSFIPFVITFGLAIFNKIDNGLPFKEYIREKKFLFLLLMCIVSSITFILQYKEWIKEWKDRKTEWENRIYFHAYNNLKRVLCAKTSAYRTKALKSGHGFLEESNIGYDLFLHIRTICDAFSLAISDMADIPSTHVSASFIYRYTYQGANDLDREWRWVIGKDSNFNIPLKDFISRDDTMYHYITNNNVDFIFYNDKKQANKEGKFYFSSKDKLYNKEGSVIAAKITFSNHAETCCEGIFSLTTYGHPLIKKHSEYTPKEFEELLKNKIFLNYEQLLKSELATLYFRHKTEKMPNRFTKALQTISTNKNK